MLHVHKVHSAQFGKKIFLNCARSSFNLSKRLIEIESILFQEKNFRMLEKFDASALVLYNFWSLQSVVATYTVWKDKTVWKEIRHIVNYLPDYQCPHSSSKYFLLCSKIVCIHLWFLHQMQEAHEDEVTMQ
jgi:hypothetical protein